MWRFIAGAFFGCLLGIIGSAFAASVTGTGRLDGWTVLDQDGDQVCSDPDVNVDKKELQCPNP
jgi:hypothetical protein